MISDKLRELKDAKKMTIQEISDRSGVPISTVSRIFSGATFNPSFQSICDIVRAMEGSLDDVAEMNQDHEAKREPPSDDLIAIYEKTIMSKNETIKGKDKWISRLFAVCLSLLAVIVIAVVADRLNANIGFFWR